MADSQAAMGMGAHRVLERVAASLGMFPAGGEVEFERALDVRPGGVLWGLPALLANGLLYEQEKYFQLPAGYYGVVSVLLLLGLMALGRVKSVEGLRYCAVGEWGKLLGLDRVPESKTLRKKIRQLSSQENVKEWSRCLSRYWMGQDTQTAGVLYVDGHVRVYHGGQTALPKRYVARERLCLRGTTDYWVNDQQGQPFFAVTQAVSAGLIEVLREEIVPRLLEDIPGQPSQEVLEKEIGRHRFVVVFDREGYSPDFFAWLWQQRIAVHSYKKYPGQDWPVAEFREVQVRGKWGEAFGIKLAERGTHVGGKFWMREIRKLTPSGHQTSILSSDFQSPASQIAVEMFSRWSQENFFKYMMEQFHLDRLVDYQTEPMDETVEVVNPAWREVGSQLRSKVAQANRQRAEFGGVVLESAREGPQEVAALEKYQHQKATLQESIERLEQDIQELKEKKKQIPHYLAIQALPEQYRFVQLARGRKHFLDTIKMIAYRAETALAALIRPKMSHVDEARTLLREIFTTEADLIPDQDQGTLTVALHHLANPISCEIARALAVCLNQTETVFPGSNLRLQFKLVSD
jgi:prepilin-type processing-associated H-X9-DG protein